MVSDYFEIAKRIALADAARVREQIDADMAHLSPEDRTAIDAAWEKHKAAATHRTTHREILFDEKCHELAVHFLADEPISTEEERAEMADRLAAHIQQTVEDWLMTP